MTGAHGSGAGATVRGLAGLAYAAVLIPIACYGWEGVKAALSGTWLGDLRIVLGVVALFALLWVAERVWAAIAPHLPDGDPPHDV